ncbi:LysM peptidoglycan-binding domain-containing protein [Streptomyces oryzae]|uniref:LysM peptidoglycan-binding domain-containing protein n=1 Tax=Streptomyces oryzae TaxID=1434886 RepID=A0ABS3XHI5_9ACTN|nr:LysM peptidoglycan-binding domain-containing protein [Streptomyces oryzae]MBO8194865.1 LysM peptidoglycan-binding domain-containing protein [Streptomyces oryzae]
MRKTKIATFGVLTAAAVAVPAAPALAQEGQSADTHTHTEAPQRQGSAPSSTPTTYEVRSGDTLSEVARNHGTNWQQLAEQNELPDPDRIYPGQRLTIGEAAPQPAPTDPDSAAPPSAEQETAPQAQEPAPQPQQEAESRTKAQAPSASTAESAAKAEIIRRESSGNPNAQNGKYYGLFQTDQPWGRGTVAEQHAGAERYVKERYGSWAAALAFHNAHGWY